MSYLDDLNEAQKEAVIKVDGPSMVIAGAGSGKTRVLTYRITHLLKNGVDPFSILSLTFTNKAAREMKERISKIIGDTEAKNITMGTFHSVFSRILRYNADKLGYPANFTIYDTQDSRSLIKTISKELGLDDKIYKPSLVLGRISSAKNNLIGPAAYESNAEIVGEDRMSGKPRLFEIYKIYAKRCFKAGAMDFDDLLFNTNVLLRDFPEVLHFYQHKFKYILVDEYQDTNYSQYLIVKKLAAVFENLCVVGDDAQSIYAFRGANIENILNFKKDYPDFNLFKLEQNYRSTKTIVGAANSVIVKNENQIKKDVWTENTDGTKIKVYRTLTDNEEGKVITNQIWELKQTENCDYEDFTILYRTNSQSRSFEENLRKLNIPYKIYGGQSFYQRKEIKDILAYYRLSANLSDEESLKRIINYPKRGIGKTTIEHIIVAANEYDVSLWEIISNVQKYQLKLSTGVIAKLNQFITMIQSFHARIETDEAYSIAQEIASSAGVLKDLYDDKSPEGVARYENIEELLGGIKEFSESQKEEEKTMTLADFMMDVALLTDVDQEKEEDKNKVSMMTIHASKGLEFPYVFVVGMEENLFPSQLSLNSRSDLEEERRLFYVAITRAEKRAFLSFATSRYRWGKLITAEPSRFIEEIDESFLEWENPYASASGGGKSLSSSRKGFKKPESFENFSGFGGKNKPKEAKPFIPKGMKKVNTSDSGTPNTDLSDLKVGYNVAHERFGKGKVVSLTGDFPNQKATVFFPRVGQKQLLLKFAKLEILN